MYQQECISKMALKEGRRKEGEPWQSRILHAPSTGEIAHIEK